MNIIYWIMKKKLTDRKNNSIKNYHYLFLLVTDFLNLEINK
jgi:hypothetical protein